TWRTMRIAGWKAEFETQMRSLQQWTAVEETNGLESLAQARLKEALADLTAQALQWFGEAERSRTIEEQALQRLAHRLRNWAEYGRIVSEGFRGTRAKAAVNVGQVATTSVERWRPMAEKKGLNLDCRSEEALWVWGEQSLLEQIMEN